MSPEKDPHIHSSPITKKVPMCFRAEKIFFSTNSAKNWIFTYKNKRGNVNLLFTPYPKFSSKRLDLNVRVNFFLTCRRKHRRKFFLPLVILDFYKNINHKNKKMINWTSKIKKLVLQKILLKK